MRGQRNRITTLSSLFIKQRVPPSEMAELTRVLRSSCSSTVEPRKPSPPVNRTDLPANISVIDRSGASMTANAVNSLLSTTETVVLLTHGPKFQFRRSPFCCGNGLDWMYVASQSCTAFCVTAPLLLVVVTRWCYRHRRCTHFK